MRPTTTSCLAVAAAALLLGCDLLGPQSEDVYLDAAVPPPIDAATAILPAGSAVPPITDDRDRIAQLTSNDGLGELADGVIKRATGKAGGAPVKYWSFGAAPMATASLPVVATVYVLAERDGGGVMVPRADHPYLVEAIPGDLRYSPIARVFHVPVGPDYDGELLTSQEALLEAIERGLVEEPVSAGTWMNLPVVRTGARLEVGPAGATAAPLEVYAHGYRVEAFRLGYVQPLRNGVVPVGHEARLYSGVAAGDGSLPAAADPQPVLQYAPPAAPPTTTFNYTPLAATIDVRLASGVAPATVTADAQLFTRTATGAITGYFPATVATYTITTTVNNRQIQFAEGSP